LEGEEDVPYLGDPSEDSSFHVDPLEGDSCLADFGSSSKIQTGWVPFVLDPSGFAANEDNEEGKAGGGRKWESDG
jgi:hypothetical protein